LAQESIFDAMKQTRLDEILIERNFAKDRGDAFVVVTEGRVFVNGQKAVSPAQVVAPDDIIEIRSGKEFVGRGAYKLDAALNEFRISPQDAVCADIGAATGGFVEVLLKHGAKKVYAIDAGRGKLDLKLREDSRVIVMEETNVLGMDPLPERVALATIDVSFTSLRFVLPAIRPWLEKEGMVVALFKPQYEIEDKTLLKKGIVRSDEARDDALESFRAWLQVNDWEEAGFMESPIRGSGGNVEFLFHLKSRA